MNMHELLNRFWLENEYETFTRTEICLYFYLLNKANQVCWQMPFKYKTETICSQLGVSKDNVIRAREGLCKRGMISFVRGKGNNSPTLYSITYRIPNGTQDVTHDGTVCGTDSGSPYGSQYNMKEKDTDISIYKERALSLDKLEEVLSQDHLWLSSLQSGLSSPIVKTELMEYLKDFFAYQNKKGYKARETNDVKKHFQKWLNQKLKNKKEYGNS